jgi:Protein of unknown function (DUF3048) N-terminal domain/Protein of unknown function (DUF3048) C-terminal domain
MAWSRRTIQLSAAGAVLAVAAGGTSFLLLGSSSPLPSHPSVRPPVSPAATPKHRAAGPLLSPFTGEPVKRLGPVLAVKIDNIVLARPQTGLTDADIVYVLPVEGGLSRFLAIFSSHFPPVIGPVRSARQDDLQLLRQFGRPAFAFSGAQPELLPVVEHARIVNLYAGIVGGYFRDPNRIAPYNLYAYPRQLLAEAHGASTAHDIGFRFGPAPAGGRARTSFSASYPAASFTFRWSARRARWLVWMDGSPAETTDDGQLRPATVVIQYTTIATSPYLEEGVRPPYAESTGSGTAVVLRDGRAYDVNWSRPSSDGGTVYTLASGQRMTFARGQVWVVLVART